MKKLGTPSGFRDILPKEAEIREYIIEKVIDVYKRFGFSPLETPVAEFEDIIVGEKATDFNLFRLETNKERQSDGEKEEIALRFDLTVPLARVVSQYGNEIPRPFKRYQLGSVFRGERPQKGRFRQFTQLDADVVGSKSLVADTEFLVIITEIMKALRVEGFVVRVNTRTLLNSLPDFAGFAENLLKEVLIVLDKAEKITEDELESELSRLRISDDAISKLKTFSKIAGGRDGVVEALEDLFSGCVEAQDGIEELKTINEGLRASGVGSSVIFDMKIIRGLGYYTGPVFETNLTKAPEFGSVLSGGRYDNLTDRFMNQSLPAVGMSVGIDRFQTALLESYDVLSQYVQKNSVAVLSNDEDYDSYAMGVAQKIRQKDIVVDMYTGNKRDFKDMFSYAESKGCAQAVVIGEDEYTSKTISIKNLKTRDQKTISLDEIDLFQW